jgi:hypothetical protein
LIEQTEQILERSEPHWPAVEAETRTRWLRDRPLLEVAAKARNRRRASARNA